MVMQVVNQNDFKNCPHKLYDNIYKILHRTKIPLFPPIKY